MDVYSDIMQLALEEAYKAYKKGEVPIGAVITDRAGNIISKGHNEKEGLNDPTSHAEVNAIKRACSRTGDWRLNDHTLYVTKEPCIMCSGAILNSRIERIVYGCNDSKGGGVDSLYNLLTDKRLNHQVEVISGVMSDECGKILKDFFDRLRYNSKGLPERWPSG